MIVKLTRSFWYLITSTFVIWFVYHIFLSKLFFNKKDILPFEFQTTYNNIRKCSELYESTKEIVSSTVNEQTKLCYASNKDNLLAIGSKTFSEIAEDQYERCLDFVTLISERTNILIGIKACTNNAQRLDASISELRETNKSKFPIIPLIITLIGYFCFEKQKGEISSNVDDNIEILDPATSVINKLPKETQKIEEIEEKVKELLKGTPETEKGVNGTPPMVRPVAQFKPFNKQNVLKRSSQTFAKPISFHMKMPHKEHYMFERPPLPLLMIPGANPNLPLIPISKTPKPIKMNAKQFQHLKAMNAPCEKSETSETISVNNINFIKDGNSSTPKKRKVSIELDGKNKDDSVPTQAINTENILKDLDNIDLDISEHTITALSCTGNSNVENKEKKDRKEMIQDNFKKCIKLVAKHTKETCIEDTKTNMKNKEVTKCDDILAEKVALSVIGNDKDNKMKTHKMTSTSLQFPPGLNVPSNGKPFNTYYNLTSSSVNQNLNPYITNVKYPTNAFDYGMANVNNNRNNVYTPYLASPLVGNPIWNTPGSSSQQGGNYYY